MSTYELSHYIGSDLSISNVGDLATSTAITRSNQRVLRRLMTNPAAYDDFGNLIAPADYIFHPDYGAGLPRWVGKLMDADKLKSLILSQMLMEPTVAAKPAPVVSVSEIGNGTGGIFASIQYTEATTNTQTTLSFSVTP